MAWLLLSKIDDPGSFKPPDESGVLPLSQDPRSVDPPIVVSVRKSWLERLAAWLTPECGVKYPHHVPSLAAQWFFPAEPHRCMLKRGHRGCHCSNFGYVWDETDS